MKRLEVVQFLRRSASMERDRLMRANQILHPEKYQKEDYEVSSDSKESVPSEYENKNDPNIRTTRTSFLQRLVLCGLFLFLFWLIGECPDDQILSQCRSFVCEHITMDESQNVFDFIKNIPYTLTYEKTDA